MTNFKPICAQTIERDVIGSSGDHYISAVAQLSWTVGEVSTEYLQTGSHQMTQGFHQPYIDVTGIENAPFGSSISIYPNPATEGIYIDYSDDYRLSLVSLYGVGGNLISKKAIVGSGKEFLDMTNLDTGVYLLVLEGVNSERLTYKVLKNK